MKSVEEVKAEPLTWIKRARTYFKPSENAIDIQFWRLRSDGSIVHVNSHIIDVENMMSRGEKAVASYLEAKVMNVYGVLDQLLVCEYPDHIEKCEPEQFEEFLSEEMRRGEMYASEPILDNLLDTIEAGMRQ